MKKESLKKLLIVGIFAAAMGFLETVVVIYLRKLYYPQGFLFPLALIEPSTLLLEWFRELSTIVMLLCIGLIAGKTKHEKCAYFLYSFAVWDIFYYIWLKLILNWPPSLLTWDLLFLIPWPWVSPVLAPVISSCTMIFLAIVMIQGEEKKNVYFHKTELLLLILGPLLQLYTFLIHYGKLIFQNNFGSQLLTLATNHDFQRIVNTSNSFSYSWMIFTVGELLLLLGIFLFWKRSKK